MTNIKNTSESNEPWSLDYALLDSRLIRQTNNKKLYNIKLINCNNYIQIYEYETLKAKIDTNLESEKRKNKKIIKNININTLKEIRKDNIFRTKLSVERLAKANYKEFTTFITLTIAENIIDINQANKLFNIWRTRIKKQYNDFKYICIPEYQKRGAVHYHLLTNLKINTKFVYLQENKKNMYNILYWDYGFSSVFCIKDLNIVGYISKYMTKDIDNRLFGHKRYFYSENLYMPKIEFLNTYIGKEKEYYINKVFNKKEMYSSSYKSKYCNEIIKFYEFKNS